MLERLNQTIKKRTRVAKIFPNIEKLFSISGCIINGTIGGVSRFKNSILVRPNKS
ncbi:MAG TPA: hypothetical protein DDZ39_10770 [Flavobacteriaceae bacterium]|nr:hypothetical protein [Flavobacteriaceae bacterium]